MGHERQVADFNSMIQTGTDIEGEDDIFFVLGANYTDQAGLTSFEQIQLHPKRHEAEFYDGQNDIQTIPNTDPWGGGSESIRVNHGGHIYFSGQPY